MHALGCPHLCLPVLCPPPGLSCLQCQGPGIGLHRRPARAPQPSAAQALPLCPIHHILSFSLQEASRTAPPPSLKSLTRGNRDLQESAPGTATVETSAAHRGANVGGESGCMASRVTPWKIVPFLLVWLCFFCSFLILNHLLTLGMAMSKPGLEL